MNSRLCNLNKYLRLSIPINQISSQNASMYSDYTGPETNFSFLCKIEQIQNPMVCENERRRATAK